MVVAVFDIHMERKAVANIKPSKILAGLLPKKIRILVAIRLCKFHFSIANAIIKPPMNKNIRWLKYIAEMVFPSTTPKIGNKTIGNKAVTAIGIISETHQTAIRMAIAKVYVISGLPGSKSAKIIISKHIIGVPINMKGFIIFFKEPIV